MPSRILPMIICLAFVAIGCATAPAHVETAPTPEECASSLATFEEVWTTIRDSHWREDMGGVDWQAVHDEFDSTVTAGVSREKLRPVLLEMISRLGVSHYDIVPGEVYEDLPGDDDDDAGDSGRTGIKLRIIDGRAVVFRVLPGSTAEETGVEPGWIVESIDGEAIATTIEKVAASQRGRTIDRYMLWRAAQMKLGGPADEAADIVFIDGDDENRTLQIERRLPAGPVSRFGNMMPLRMRTEERRLDGDIGYFTFNVFADAPRLMKSWNEAMDDFVDCRGVVVDLRGNPGGIGILAAAMAGAFVGENGHTLGTMTMRTGELKFPVNRRPKPFTGPVAVLIDELSASTAEIMAAGLRDIGRGRVFGTLTAGAALPSHFKQLPNGDVLQYAVAMFTTPQGQEIEGVGISPDVEVPLTREALLAGGDPVLDTALAWLETMNDKGDDE